jgi:hypothetical protein
MGFLESVDAEEESFEPPDLPSNEQGGFYAGLPAFSELEKHLPRGVDAAAALALWESSVLAGEEATTADTELPGANVEQDVQLKDLPRIYELRLSMLSWEKGFPVFWGFLESGKLIQVVVPGHIRQHLGAEGHKTNMFRRIAYRDKLLAFSPLGKWRCYTKSAENYTQFRQNFGFTNYHSFQVLPLAQAEQFMEDFKNPVQRVQRKRAAIPKRRRNAAAKGEKKRQKPSDEQ